MADGTHLRTLHWAPDGPPVAVALIVHGLGEHGGRYGTVAAMLTRAGVDTWSYDHRGHGGSGGRRNHVERWSQLHGDLQERIERLRADRPGLPFILYGHSMGGLIVAGYELADPPRPLPDVTVLSAPGLDADLARWKKPLARLLTGIVPKMKVTNGLPDGGLSRDPDVRRRADEDPLNTSSSTVRFGAEAFDEQDRVNAQLRAHRAMPTPTYVFHGSADPIVPLRATEVFEGMTNVTRHVHDGLRHECHHEPEHEHVLGEVVAWLATQGVPVRLDADAAAHHHHHEDEHDAHHEPHAPAVEADVHADPATAV